MEKECQHKSDQNILPQNAETSAVEGVRSQNAVQGNKLHAAKKTVIRHNPFQSTWFGTSDGQNSLFLSAHMLLILYLDDTCSSFLPIRVKIQERHFLLVIND